MFIFLDFDGVLHPSCVALQNSQPVLEGAGRLFMWAPVLAEALGDREDVLIVLSTSWVGAMGFKATATHLPESLRRRVIGSTHNNMASVWGGPDSKRTRYQEILGFVRRHCITEPWFAIDDLHESSELGDWPEADRHRLILTNPVLGLSDPLAVAALRAALAPAACLTWRERSR